VIELSLQGLCGSAGQRVWKLRVVMDVLMSRFSKIVGAMFHDAKAI